MARYEDVQERLTRIAPNLPPQLRKAATYLLDNPGQVATQSMRKVAVEAGIALPNLARLAKSVGFEKYSELRDVYRMQVQFGSAGNYPERADRLQSSGKASGKDATWDLFRTAALSNVEAAYARIDPATVAGIAANLQERDHIYIVGMQSSSPFADYFNYVGGMAMPNIRQLGRRGGVIADDLVDINAGDALISVAIQPCARTTVEVAELAFERGAYVVGITDSLASPLAAYSSDVLLTSCNSPLFFESYVGTTAILELLIGFMTMRAGHEAVERIAQIEADRVRMGEYWQPSRGDRTVEQ